MYIFLELKFLDFLNIQKIYSDFQLYYEDDYINEDTLTLHIIVPIIQPTNAGIIQPNP